MRWLVTGCLLASELAAAAPARVHPRVECRAEPATCEAVAAAIEAGAQAERVATTPEDADLELVVKVEPAAEFFELRERGTPRFIAHTDVVAYRAPYTNEDAAVALAFLSVALAPIALDLRHPTTLADRTRAWTVMTRRVLRHGLRAGKTYVGAREARGARWTVRFGTPEVRRHPMLLDDTVLASDADFEPVAADASEALEASYSASLLLPSLVQMLDDTDGLVIGDGKATLVVQTIHSRFHPSLVVRGNPALARSLPRSSKLIPPRAPAIHLAGATRILIPIVVKRR